jgi:hypothetical protein
VRFSVLGQLKEVAGVAVGEIVGLAGRVQPLPRVLADHLQHVEAERIVARHHPLDEAVVHQRLQAIKHLHPETLVADPLGRLAGPPAREDRQVGEEASLVRVEQLVAPVDRRAQRALTPRKVASTSL